MPLLITTSKTTKWAAVEDGQNASITTQLVKQKAKLAAIDDGDHNASITTHTENQRTDSPKSLLACKVLMECCVSSMQFYTIHAKKIDDIPMLPILYDKMELYGIY